MIKLCREYRGLTQRALAIRAGVSVNTIASAETGRHRPTYETVVACLRACGFALMLTERSTND